MQLDNISEAVKLTPPVAVIATGWVGLVNWSALSYAMTAFYMLLLSIAALYKGYRFLRALRDKPGAS